MPRRLTLVVNHDSDAENPSDRDQDWKVHSFCRSHSDWKDPQDEDLQIDRNGFCSHYGLRTRLKYGMAFILSYYEHGDCCWMLRGSTEWAACPDKQWDAVEVAGVMIWTHGRDALGAKNPNTRADDAKRFLEQYTAWCNGHVYCAHLEEDGMPVDDLPSVGNCYDAETVVEYVLDTVEPDDLSLLQVDGPAAFLVENEQWALRLLERLESQALRATVMGDS